VPLTGWRAQVLAGMQEAICRHVPEPHVGPVEDIWCHGCLLYGEPTRWPCPSRVYAERIASVLNRRAGSRWPDGSTECGLFTD